MKTYQEFLDNNGEANWQKYWEENKLFEAKDNDQRKKYYCLIEFPYPSSEGLHVGHPRSYTALDVVARKRRMKGYNVLYPIGWDAFGLPAENHAIKTGTHPRIKTEENIANYKRQLKSLGFSFDWSREIDTTDPKYYKWTQWIFLQLFKKGLAYKAEMAINFCTDCKVGLANEEVVSSKCERCGGEVIKKTKKQWMLKITEYADRLEKDLDKVDYLEKIKLQQKNWIGRSEGAEVEFGIKNYEPCLPAGRLRIKVYTTRPDTLFGATYMVLAPEHELVRKMKDQIENFDEVQKYIEDASKKSDMERTELAKDKTGVELKGIKAINPVNNKEIPVWISDYVLISYGTGAIMAVPAHDERDFEFALKFDLPIIQVIAPTYKNFRSYLMGAKNISDKDLTDIGIKIIKQLDDGDRQLEIPHNKIEDYENLITEKLDLGFWNEYVGEKIVFIFKFKAGQIKRLELDKDTAEEIDQLAVDFTNEKRTNQYPWNWLAKNGFYTNYILNVNVDSGKMVNSDFLNGLAPSEAIGKMINWLEKKGLGKKAVNYKLRDWVFSRQRYWGEPIPLVFCENCAEGTNDGESLNPGWLAIDEKDLPLELPEIENFQAGEDGESPLAKLDSWVNVKCPKCGGPAKRETDTMPQWAGSSWYFLRYIDPRNDKELASQKKLKYWSPVDWYNGGAEHITLHLLYSRFWHKFLFDIGVVPTAEPYIKRTSQGMVLGEGGEKMSKSRGNVVNPDDVVKEYGADTLRLYELFMGPFDQAIPWDTKGVIGVKRFLEKVWNLFADVETRHLPGWLGRTGASSVQMDIEILLNKTIKKVGEDIETMKFNTAISALMILVNKIIETKSISQDNLKKLLVLLSPFAPHISEELWQKLGHKKSISLEKWPEYNKSKIKDEFVEFVVQINGKVRAKMQLATDIAEAEAIEAVKSDPNVQKYLAGQEIKKTIFVSGKLISFVV